MAVAVLEWWVIRLYSAKTKAAEKAEGKSKKEPAKSMPMIVTPFALRHSYRLRNLS